MKYSVIRSCLNSQQVFLFTTFWHSYQQNNLSGIKECLMSRYWHWFISSHLNEEWIYSLFLIVAQTNTFMHLYAFLFSNNRHESYFVLSAVLISPPGCKRPPGSSPPSQLRRLDSEGFIRCLSASTPPKCSSSPARIWVWAAGRRFGFHSRAPTALFITREGRWGPGRGTSGKSS